MKWTRSAVLCACLLLACKRHGDAHLESGARQPSVEPITVSLRVDVRTASDVAARGLVKGEVLHGGDRFVLLVSVDRPAHVSVVKYSASGWSEVLYPEGGERELPQGSRVRLPQGEEWFHLDSQPGDETLYVVATRAPMDAGLRSLLRLPPGTGPGGAGSRGDKPPPPPPPPAGVRTHERGQQIQGEGAEVRARTDDQGVAVLPLVLRHE